MVMVNQIQDNVSIFLETHLSLRALEPWTLLLLVLPYFQLNRVITYKSCIHCRSRIVGLANADRLCRVVAL